MINQIKTDPELAFKRQQHGVPLAAHQRMSNSLEKEFIPPWWDKENIHSKTSETGEPLFEKEEPEKLASKINKIVRLSKFYYKLATKS